MEVELFTKPSTYDSYITTNIERRNFDEVVRQIAKHQSNPSILDLCCGTGIFAREWLSRLNSVRYVGVDIDEDFIVHAKSFGSGEFLQGDAVDFRLEDRFDVVMGTSAYHHIEDERKKAFLENMKRHLREEGSIIIYEKFVAPFFSSVEAVKSGARFYLERIEDIAREQDLNEERLYSLLTELYLTSSRQFEYKVPFERFAEDVGKTGLKIIDEVKLWPLDDRFRNPNVGDFVVVLE